MARMTQTDYIALGDLIRAHCTTTMDGDTKVATYEQGWSDQKIAREMSKTHPHIHQKHVQKLRLALMGEVRSNIGGNNTGPLRDKLEATCAEIRTLKDKCNNFSEQLVLVRSALRHAETVIKVLEPNYVSKLNNGAVIDFPDK